MLSYFPTALDIRAYHRNSQHNIDSNNILSIEYSVSSDRTEMNLHALKSNVLIYSSNLFLCDFGSIHKLHKPSNRFFHTHLTGLCQLWIADDMYDVSYGIRKYPIIYTNVTSYNSI